MGMATRLVLFSITSVDKSDRRHRLRALTRDSASPYKGGRKSRFDVARLHGFLPKGCIFITSMSGATRLSPEITANDRPEAFAPRIENVRRVRATMLT
jgi:hypothetical protein